MAAAAQSGGRVEPSQRFTRFSPCPICLGWQSGPKGQHCYGYMSKDGRRANCTEQQYAGALPQNRDGTFTHPLDDGCRCGIPHGETPHDTPRPQAMPARPAKRNLHALIPHTLRDGWHKTMEFPYHNADGSLLYKVVRYDPPATYAGEKKRTLPYQPVGDMWACDEQGLTRILYRLPELQAADTRRPVFIPEGEKCVEALRAIGLVATTNPGGAGKWHTILEGGSQETLRGRHVVILPDADEPGRQHAADVAAHLAGVAASVRVVELPGLEDGEDIADWIDAGGTKDTLYELVIATPVTQAAAHEERAGEASEILKTANVRMNEKIHLMQRTVTAAAMKPSTRVALLTVRREIERNAHQLDSDGMLTIYKMDEMAKEAGLSVGTLRKEIDLLAGGGVLRKKHVPTPNGNKLVAIGYDSLIDAPWEAPLPEKAPHGGKRAGAGRPKKCPECGSTNIRVTKKTVLVIRCRNHACGTITEKTLGEQEVTNLDEVWAEGTENQDEFHPPEEAGEHLETPDTFPSEYETAIKMNVTPSPACPTCGGDTYRDPFGLMRCRSCLVPVEAIAS